MQGSSKGGAFYPGWCVDAGRAAGEAERGEAIKHGVTRRFRLPVRGKGQLTNAQKGAQKSRASKLADKALDEALPLEASEVDE